MQETDTAAWAAGASKTDCVYLSFQGGGGCFLTLGLFGLQTVVHLDTAVHLES